MSKFKVGDWVVRAKYLESSIFSFEQDKPYFVEGVRGGVVYLRDVPSNWHAVNFELATVESAVSARNKYDREVSPGVWVDVYDVLNAWKVTDPCLQHLIKKALAVGQRGHKDTATDYKDILDSAQRAVDIFKQWENK